MFLAYWAFEEYENNVYFQTYVNATVQANVFLIAGVVVGIPALALVTLRIRRGRASPSEQVVDIEENSQSFRGSHGVFQQSQGEAQAVSPIAAELSSRFLNQGASPSTQTPTQARMPVLQRLDQATTTQPKMAETGLPFLKQVEPRREPVETKPGQIETPRYQGGPQAVSPAFPRDADYESSRPVFSRPPDNPVPRRPPSGVPLARPPTVVTGIVGQGPRQFPSTPPQGPGPGMQGQRPESRPFQEKWEPGVRPPGPLGFQPSRPQQFTPLASTRLGSSSEASQTILTTGALGRIGSTRPAGEKGTGVESSPGLNRIEPVQAVANKLSWGKSNTPTVVRGAPGQVPENLGLMGSDASSGVLGKQKPGPSVKRDEKQEGSGDGSGS